MNTVLLIIGSVFVFIAAILHLYIFFLESVLWTRPSTWKIFGVKNQEEADIIKPMAFNQGFYNVFLGLGAGLGLVLLDISRPAGLALIFMGAGSMVLAALVLLVSSKTNRRGALIQGVPPLIGVVLLVLGLTLA